MLQPALKMEALCSKSVKQFAAPQLLEVGPGVLLRHGTRLLLMVSKMWLCSDHEPYSTPLESAPFCYNSLVRLGASGPPPFPPPGVGSRSRSPSPEFFTPLTHAPTEHGRAREYHNMTPVGLF